MKLKHFYSDWNGLRSNTAYHTAPTIKEIQKAKPTEHSKGARVFKRKDGINIIVTDTIVEVKTRIDNSFYGNLYRDLYSYSK